MDEFFQKLEKYYSLLNDKATAESALMDEAKYMEIYYPRPILQLKKIVPLDSLLKLKMKLHVLWAAVILAVVFIIFGAVLGAVGIVLLVVPGLLALIFLLFFAINTTSEFKDESSWQEKLRKENEEKELWNQAEYLKLKEYEKRFEESNSERKSAYEKSQIEAKNELEQINSELEKYADFVPEDYVPEEYVDDLYSLLEIAESGRAYNLSDAIDIFDAEYVCRGCVYADRCRKFGTPDCPSYIPCK